MSRRLTLNDVVFVALLAIPASAIPDTAPRADPRFERQMQSSLATADFAALRRAYERSTHAAG